MFTIDAPADPDSLLIKRGCIFLHTVNPTNPLYSIFAHPTSAAKLKHNLNNSLKHRTQVTTSSNLPIQHLRHVFMDHYNSILVPHHQFCTNLTISNTTQDNNRMYHHSIMAIPWLSVIAGFERLHQCKFASRLSPA